ncbi:MAG: hypothetical protein JXB62_04330 [Pirellulales bacterium]|nr:hypothetical protein [Pirellulales bacterium]
MRHTSLLLATVISAAGISLAGRATAAEHGSRTEPGTVTVASKPVSPGLKTPITARQYRIDCRLVQTAPDSPSRVLASPTLVVSDGRLAVVRIGREVPPPNGSELAKGPFEGVTCEIHVYRTERGQTFLDANLQASWIRSNGKNSSVRVVNVGVHVIEAITLGEKTVVPTGVGNGDVPGDCFELSVEMVRPIAARPGKPTLY